jgi:hypothetical protein
MIHVRKDNTKNERKRQFFFILPRPDQELALHCILWQGTDSSSGLIKLIVRPTDDYLAALPFFSLLLCEEIPFAYQGFLVFPILFHAEGHLLIVNTSSPLGLLLHWLG